MVRDQQQRDLLRLARTIGTSPSILLGRSPATRTVYLDTHGEPCTMGEAFESRTEREPDWTDADHRKMQALSLYESQLCDQCGFHDSLHDPEGNFYLPEWDSCAIAKGYAVEERKQEKRDGKHDESAISRPSDGRRLLMRRLSDEEVDDLRSRKAERGAGSSPHVASASSSTSKSTATRT